MNTPVAPTLRWHIKSRPSLRAAVAMVDAAGLPVADLTEVHLEHFFFCGPTECPAALVGLELYGSDALLRSLVVTPDFRSAGLGSAMVRHAESYARDKGVRAMYLLTNTAEALFSKLGYVRIARGDVTGPIRCTREFRELCPESSALMFKPQ